MFTFDHDRQWFRIAQNRYIVVWWRLQTIDGKFFGEVGSPFGGKGLISAETEPHRDKELVLKQTQELAINLLRENCLEFFLWSQDNTLE